MDSRAALIGPIVSPPLCGGARDLYLTVIVSHLIHFNHGTLKACISHGGYYFNLKFLPPYEARTTLVISHTCDLFF